MQVEKNLVSMGLTLPEPPQPVANYEPAVMDEDLLYTSGQVVLSMESRSFWAGWAQS